MCGVGLGLGLGWAQGGFRAGLGSVSGGFWEFWVGFRSGLV